MWELRDYHAVSSLGFSKKSSANKFALSDISDQGLWKPHVRTTEKRRNSRFTFAVGRSTNCLKMQETRFFAGNNLPL